MKDEHFWDDKKNSTKIVEELNLLKNKQKKIIDIKNKIDENLDMLELLKGGPEEEIALLLEEDLPVIKKE